VAILIPPDGGNNGDLSPGRNGRLLPQHLADLRKSGLSDEQIALCGFTSFEAAGTIQSVLKWKRYKGQLGACLVIPFLDADGNGTGYTRLKPDRPRTAKEDGKAIKYESPKGSANRPYFPPHTRSVLRDVSVPLVIVEGEKKAARADQDRIATIGLVGVYGWQKKRRRDADGQAQGPRELIDGLADLAWQGRLVYLAFDSDAASNINVRRAEWNLAEVLAGLGAVVRVVRLPPGPDGEKVGVDDFLVANGLEPFKELLKTAEAPRPPVAVAPLEAPDDPHRLARLYVDERCRHADGLTLRRYRSEWQRWGGSNYTALPDAELSAEVTASAKAELDRVNLQAQAVAAALGEPPPDAIKVTRNLIGNVEQALASLTVLPGSVEQSTWLGEGRRNLVALDNGVLDLDALFAGRADVVLPHSPLWFSPVCLPYAFDPDADCPKWRAVLERNLEGDPERIALLQEWFGYCLTPDTSRQKFLLMVGEGANGKSVMCAALEAVLGADNCSHVPLENFGDRFQLTAALSKLANVCAECGELDKAAEGHLKSFTSGDCMAFDRKFKDPIAAVPSARLVVATNNLPRFSDRSGGLWRRMIVLPFRVVISDDDPSRVYGMDKPTWWLASGELPGVLNWSLAGLDRLRDRNRFTESAVCGDALAEYRRENNPARMFLTECCRPDPQQQTPCTALYRAYRTWCESHGYSPLSDVSFGKEVRRVFRNVERREVGARGSRVYAYFGVGTDQVVL
jgi:P4 family phage/plasmid primase-like protien